MCNSVCWTMSHAKSLLHWSVIHFKVTCVTFWAWFRNVYCQAFLNAVQFGRLILYIKRSLITFSKSYRKSLSLIYGMYAIYGSRCSNHSLTYISPASFLRDICKQRRPRSDSDQCLHSLLTECSIKI